MGLGVLKPRPDITPELTPDINFVTVLQELVEERKYNKAISQEIKEETGSDVVRARSAWTGSQRYLLHWGGDSSPNYMNIAPQMNASEFVSVPLQDTWQRGQGTL